MQHIHSLILLTPTSYTGSFFGAQELACYMRQIFIQSKPTDCPLVKNKKKKKLLFSSSPQLVFPWGDNFAFLLPLHAAHAPKRRGDGRSFLTSIFILFHFFFFGVIGSHRGYRRAFDDDE
jgi:hypothetical protein